MNYIFIKNLKESRHKKGLTQKKIAIILDVVESCYANWEQGRTEPDTKTIAKLSQILEVSSDYLLGLEEEDGTKTNNGISNSFNNINNTSIKIR